MADSSNFVIACPQHLLGRAIVWTLNCLPQKIMLGGSDHVAPARYVIEHLSHVCIVNAFIFDSKHQDAEYSVDVTMQEDFIFVGESFPHQPGLTSP